MEFLSHHFRLATLLELGDIRGVDVELDACAHLAGELSQPVMLWQTCVFQAMRAMLAGRFEEGWHYAQEALELGQGSQGAIAAVHFGTQSFQYYWGTGSLAELEEPTRAFAQRYPSSAWRAGLTFLYADTGREDKARAEFERFATRGFGVIRREGNWVSIIAFLSLACVHLRESARAADLYTILEPYADRSVVVGAGANCIGSVSLYLGHLATVMQRWDDAERHFRRALEHDELMGNRPFVVYAGLAWSAMLLDRDAADDRERAAEMVSRVLPMAREMRMTSMVARAESLQASVSVSASSR
jgi:tetratricopeptide (TPR) repeat protein